MSRAEALQVIEAARQNRRTAICRIDLERLADGSYAVLLDNTVTTIPRQTYIYAVQEWQTRTAAIKDCFELFGVAPRRSLRELLQERGGKR